MSYNGIGCAAGESGESAGGIKQPIQRCNSVVREYDIGDEQYTTGTRRHVCPMCLVARVFYFIQRVTALLTLGSRPELARS